MPNLSVLVKCHVLSSQLSFTGYIQPDLDLLIKYNYSDLCSIMSLRASICCGHNACTHSPETGCGNKTSLVIKWHTAVTVLR